MEQARVLLVEDEAIIAMELEARLNQLGHSIVGIASNAEDAFDLAERSQPDLALLDIHIQGRRDGIETAGQLAERFGIPIVFLTAYADDATLARAREVAPYGYLVKPMRERELNAAIELALYRHRMERELRTEKAKFQRVVENIKEGLLIDDAQGRAVFANAEFLRIFGLAQDDLAGLELEDYIAPEWRDLLGERHARRIQGEAVPADFEYEGLRKDGKRIWVAVRVATLSEDGVVSGTLSTVQDITQAKKMRDALARRDRQLLEAQRIALLGSWEWRLDSDELYWSPEMQSIYGVEIAQPLKNPRELLQRLTHPEDRERVAANIAATLATGVPWDHEYRILRPDGGLAFVHGRGELQRDGLAGELVVFGSAQDITERRLREIEQAKFEQQMQQVQRLESLGVLAGGIAHDFNNLLTAILGNITLMRLELGDACPVEELLDEAETASQRAAELCRQMLAYSGRGRVVVEPVDLSALAREMLAILEVSLGGQVKLELELAESLPTVEADATQLRQIVMNLIVNASEAIGDAPGAITLRTRSEQLPAGRMQVAFTDEGLPEGHYVSLSVADSGSGMDGETLQRIFEPFFSTKYTGRGLGLAAVAGILRSHRGAIRVESQPGAGTVFTIWLPAARSGPAVAPRARSAATALEGRLLLVDDSEPVRNLACGMLRRFGLSVEAYPSGPAALAALAAAEAPPPDCAMLDLSMPEMDGVTLLRRLRERLPQLPVVFTSGYTEEELPPDLSADPRCRFVEKPYGEESLREALAALLRPPA